MRALKLGHAVLKVRSLAVSIPFYRDVLGLTEVARYGAQMAFFSCGDNHHDLALLEIGAQAAAPVPGQVGLITWRSRLASRWTDCAPAATSLRRTAWQWPDRPTTASARRCIAMTRTAS